MIGALDPLRSDSTLRACLHLADEMDGREYHGTSAMSFVPWWYSGRRNALVHGRKDRPTLQEANMLAANLTRFVGDLLAGRVGVDEVEAVRQRLTRQSGSA